MSSPLARTLQVAEGYLELGDPQQAESQLENLEGDDRTRIEVWALRCKIYMATEQWAAMRNAAKHLVLQSPLDLEYWLWAAEADKEGRKPWKQLKRS